MERILYFSNSARLDWWRSLSRTDYEAPQGVAAMAHGGLPTARELRLLQMLHDEAGAPVTVFGDADPDDLLVYSALRAGIEGASVEYDGVTSELIVLAEETLGKGWVERAARPFNRREARLLRFIRAKALVDIESLLGKRAAAILDSGRRLELEGVLPAMLLDQKARQAILERLNIDVTGYSSTS